LSRVINGRAGISPDLAIRLERAGVNTAREELRKMISLHESTRIENGMPNQ